MAGGGAVKFYVDPGGEEGCFWEFCGVGMEYLFGFGDELELGGYLRRKDEEKGGGNLVE